MKLNKTEHWEVGWNVAFNMIYLKTGQALILKVSKCQAPLSQFIMDLDMSS